MALASLEDLYVDILKDLYSAENQIVKALPKMVKSAGTPELRSALQEHLDSTRQHVQRLEQIFDELGKSPKGKKCKGMEGLIEEGSDLMGKKAEPDVLDAGLIASAQKVEHYEMACYGTVRTYAQTLGYHDHADLLQQTLDEEGEADERLTLIAEGLVNPEAAEAETEDRARRQGAVEMDRPRM